MLRVDDLVKRYSGALDNLAAVRGVSFEVSDGEFFTLLGPSGCGKTTTLRAIAGLEIPDSGTIEIAGVEVYSGATGKVVPAHRRPLSMVFQSYALWPHMSVIENVAFPLRAARVGRSQAHKRAMESLEIVGLERYARRMPGALSGGQQQRVALARAVVGNSKMLLLDEPLSNLDAKLRLQMRDEIKSLQVRYGSTIVYVTHDQEEAIMLSDRVAVMQSGSIVEMGRPEQLYTAPHDLYTARFMGDHNLIPGELESSDESGATVISSLGRILSDHFNGTASGNRRCYVVVRPEAIELRPRSDTEAPTAANEFAGVVESTVYLGRISEHKVRVGESTLSVQRLGGSRLVAGDAVVVSLDADRCGVYPAETDPTIDDQEAPEDTGSAPSADVEETIRQS